MKQYLFRNKAWLDGVVMTGGEPTIHVGLPDLCRQIKELGFRVKLGTSGTNSRMVREMMVKGLVDFVALDIKAPLTATGVGYGYRNGDCFIGCYLSWLDGKI